MGYVHPHRPDIFLSYAHIDNETDQGFGDKPGWVTTLSNILKNRVNQKLDHNDSCQIWSDCKDLSGNVEFTPEILRNLRESAVILLILSPSYLGSEWCSNEFREFQAEIGQRTKLNGRVFAVEFEEVDPDSIPDYLKRLNRYKFWKKGSGTRHSKPLGFPTVSDSDQDYHNILNDLRGDIGEELKRLRQGERDIRPAVYLAESSITVEQHRILVRRHLDQAGFRVLPEIHPSNGLLDADLDHDLGRALLFIELLGDTGGEPRTLRQHQRAVALDKPVLQWRHPTLNIDSLKITESHRKRLNGDSVIAAEPSEFARMVVERAKNLHKTPETVPSQRTSRAVSATKPNRSSKPKKSPLAIETSRPADPSPNPNPAVYTEKLIFINAEPSDSKATGTVKEILMKIGVNVLTSVVEAEPERIRETLNDCMRLCDGMLLLHGDNPTWSIYQWKFFNKIKPQRDDPNCPIGVCDLPPPDKRCKAVDQFGIPSIHMIDCRDGLVVDKFASFLRHVL